MLSVALRSSSSCSRTLPSLALSSSRHRTSHTTRIYSSRLSHPNHLNSIRNNSTQPKSKGQPGATSPSAPTPISNASASSTLESSSSIDTSSPEPITTAEDEKNTIPLLDRPLGVAEPPSAEEKSWKEKGSEFMDSEKQLEKRKALIRQASSGYFYDLHMTRRHGGKTWMAPKVLIRQEKALYFPDIVGHRLDNGEKAHTTAMCKGKVTVVSMLTTKISESHAQAYTERVNETYASNPSYQYLQINLQENVLKSLLVNLFLSSLRSTIPTALHPTYLVSRQNMDYVRDSLLMTNSRIGYTYVLDEDLKVRWGACADAKPEEEEALFRGVGVLLNRLDKAKVGSTGAGKKGVKK